jgi:shikimate dehydrogenase
VIGYPVKHSRSPKIHTYWLEELGLDGSYEAIEVRPDELASFVRSMAARGFAGTNVTVPHKEMALALCDEVSPGARALGAVNTLWLRDRRIHGDNSDVFGFLANLDEGAPGWDREAKTALVLGAGGAARAVVYALRERGVTDILIANRTRERAEALAAAFGMSTRALDWQRLEEVLPRCALVINTTTLGMQGQPPLEINVAALPPSAIVCDIVYAPLETGLLIAAATRGLRTVGGLGMLLHQAVLGFQHWFGATPKVTPELRALISADIARRL